MTQPTLERESLQKVENAINGGFPLEVYLTKADLRLVLDTITSQEAEMTELRAHLAGTEQNLADWIADFKAQELRLKGAVEALERAVTLGSLQRDIDDATECNGDRDRLISEFDAIHDQARAALVEARGEGNMASQGSGATGAATHSGAAKGGA